MNQHVRLDNLNELSLIDYLRILGFEPIAFHPGSTDYVSPFNHKEPQILSVNHKDNRFTAPGTHQKGTLVEFACLLYGCTPSELCNNIVPYKIDRLMSL